MSGAEMVERFKYLDDYEFSGCAVRHWNIIAFFGQQWGDTDALEVRKTGVFFYYPDESPDEQWGFSEIGLATGIHGCAAFVPEERWVFVVDDGEVYVVGGGEDDFEQRIPAVKNAFFSNVKSVRRGPAIAVGPRRKVYVRRGSNRWTQIDNGLYPKGTQTDLEHAGFTDIDGFSETDMYACGGRGDLWRWDGTIWTPIDLPSDAVLRNICCAEDGMVYITTNRRNVIKGRDDRWEVIAQDVTTQVLEEIVDFDGTILISTVSAIYELRGNQFRTPDIGDAPLRKSKAHLAAGDGILVVAGRDEAAIFDGKAWRLVLEPAP